MHKLNRYIGRIVRLNNLAFHRLLLQAQRQGIALENSFLVTAVNGKLKKLVCYGAGFRLLVSVSDVVLV